MRTLKSFLIPAAILIIMGCLLSTNVIGNKQEPEIQENDQVFQLVNSGKSDYAVIRQHPLEEGQTKIYGSVQEMLDDFAIDGYVAPTWVPKRLGEPVVQAENSSYGLQLRIDFRADNDFLNIYYSESPPTNNRSTEKDSVGATTEMISGIEHHIVVDLGITKVVWINGELECHLSGNLSEKEMKEVLYSIYED